MCLKTVEEKYTGKELTFGVMYQVISNYPTEGAKAIIAFRKSRYTKMFLKWNKREWRLRDKTEEILAKRISTNDYIKGFHGYANKEDAIRLATMDSETSGFFYPISVIKCYCAGLLARGTQPNSDFASERFCRYTDAYSPREVTVWENIFPAEVVWDDTLLDQKAVKW